MNLNPAFSIACCAARAFIQPTFGTVTMATGVGDGLGLGVGLGVDFVLAPVLGAMVSALLIPTSCINGARSTNRPASSPMANTPRGTGTIGNFLFTTTGLGTAS